MTGVKHMKWWGWGLEGVGFHHDDKPGFAPFVLDAVKLDLSQPAPDVKPDLESLPVPVPKMTDAFAAQLVEAVGEERLETICRQIMLYHLDRGYDRMEVKLRALGANIQRVAERTSGKESA